MIRILLTITLAAIVILGLIVLPVAHDTLARSKNKKFLRETRQFFKDLTEQSLAEQDRANVQQERALNNSLRTQEMAKNLTDMTHQNLIDTSKFFQGLLNKTK
jgi:ABC-type transport system involved in cytochrome bd biosynthesis fused ATPase/permease subunit